MADPRAHDVSDYTISFAADGTLQFDPPQDSKELAIALSIHFPLQKTLEEKMRAAMKLFLHTSNQYKSRAAPNAAENNTIPNVTYPTSRGRFREHYEEEINQTTETHSVQLDSGAQPDTILTISHYQPEIPSKKRPRKPRKESDFQSENTAQRSMLHVWDFRTGQNKQKRIRRNLDADESVQVYGNRGNICDHHKSKKTKCDPLKCRGNKLFVPSATDDKQSKDLESAITTAENFLAGYRTDSCPTECKVASLYSHISELIPCGSQTTASSAPTSTTTHVSSKTPLEVQALSGMLGFDLKNWSSTVSLSPSLVHDLAAAESYYSDSTSQDCNPLSADQYYGRVAELEDEEERKKEKKDDEDEARATSGRGPGNDDGGGGMGGMNGKNGGDDDGDDGSAGSGSTTSSNGSCEDPFMGWIGGNWDFSMSMFAILAYFYAQCRIKSSLGHILSWAKAAFANFFGLLVEGESERNIAGGGASCSGIGHKRDEDSSAEALQTTVYSTAAPSKSSKNNISRRSTDAEDIKDFTNEVTDLIPRLIIPREATKGVSLSMSVTPDEKASEGQIPKFPQPPDYSGSQLGPSAYGLIRPAFYPKIAGQCSPTTTKSLLRSILLISKQDQAKHMGRRTALRISAPMTILVSCA